MAYVVDYAVALEQTQPYEFHVIEVFHEEADALDYADRYANGHGYIQLSRRRWRSAHDHKQCLIVWKRKE